MHEALVTYFQAEKQSSLAWGFAGVAAVAGAVGLLARANPYRAMVVPLLAVAAIQIGIAAVLRLRTDTQIANLSEQLRSEPARFKVDEGARIARVNRSFKAIEAAEIALLAAGIALALLAPGKPRLFAVGLGLIWQASATLIIDLTAERRARIYAAAVAAMP